MRLVFGLVLVLGMALAGFAVYSAKNYMAEQRLRAEAAEAAAATAVKTVNIYAVDRAVKYGERIGLADLRVVPYPADALPKGVFQSEEELFPREGEKFRTVMREMDELEPLLSTKVSDQGADAGVSSRLGTNMRAFTINVSASSGVFLRPGDRVDVYWTGQSPNANEGQITKIIEASLRIIATDQDTEASSSSESRVARTVTVEISPQQVARLTQAQASGTLTLSLVGTDDQSTASAVDENQRTLLGIEETVAPKVESQQECGVKVRRPGETVQETINCD